MKILWKLPARKIILNIVPENGYDGEKIYSPIQLVDALARLNDTDNDNFSYDCRDFSDEQIKYLFEIVWTTGKCVLFIEEFASFMEHLNNYPYLEKCIRQGRHNYISIIGCSQRVPDFPPDVRSQVNCFISFKQYEPIDIEYLLKRGFILEEINSLVLFDDNFSENQIEEKVHYLHTGENLNDIKEWFKIKENISPEPFWTEIL
jgi:hypothetical protein